MGYTGRIGVYEVLLADEAVREALMNGASRDDLQRIALDGGMVPMRDQALERVVRGLSSVEELVRVIR